MEPGADLGPLVTRDAKSRVEGLISRGEEEGAKVILDGRGLVVPGYENGNFVGPTIIHHVKVSAHLDEYSWRADVWTCDDVVLFVYLCDIVFLLVVPRLNPLKPTDAIWVQLYSILCQYGLSRHL